MRVAELGEFIASKTGSTNPSNFPNEQFEYYSIPAYDNGEPEVTLGSSIGSSKKNFLPGDVLLSRIVPHIRRCWIVPENNGYKQIGSGEWIVFRTNDIIPSFLRFYLMSDGFNIKFMKTIKGVGGSLMRADPNQVKRFKISLPPLKEQKKIATILGAADDYRQKTKALIDKYDQLTQSLFLDMFGDPLTNPKGWRKAPLGEVIVSKTGSINPLNFPNELFEYFSIPAFDKGQPEITLGSSIGSSKKHFQPGDVLLSRIVPHIRRCWIIPEGQGYRQIGSGEWIVFKSGHVNPNFLRFYLTSDFFHAQFMKTIKGVGGSLMRADIGQVKRLKFYTPPQDVQLEFNKMVVKIEKQKHQAEASLVKAEELFNSLLQKAFKGELTN